MSFFTVVNCMDGRVQLPVINFLKNRFKVEYVDSITEPGPILALATCKDKVIIDSILKRIKISLDRHKSKGIALVGHYDCAGNPVSKEQQLVQLKKSKDFIKKHFKEIDPVLLWVDEKWEVHDVTDITRK